MVYTSNWKAGEISIRLFFKPHPQLCVWSLGPPLHLAYPTPQSLSKAHPSPSYSYRSQAWQAFHCMWSPRDLHSMEVHPRTTGVTALSGGSVGPFGQPESTGTMQISGRPWAPHREHLSKLQGNSIPLVTHFWDSQFRLHSGLLSSHFSPESSISLSWEFFMLCSDWSMCVCLLEWERALWRVCQPTCSLLASLSTAASQHPGEYSQPHVSVSPSLEEPEYQGQVWVSGCEDRVVTKPATKYHPGIPVPGGWVQILPAFPLPWF